MLSDTVEGGFLVNGSRKIVKYFRYFGKPQVRQHEESLGDVLFPIEAYKDFAVGFSSHKVHLMSLLLMARKTFIRRHLNTFFVRALLRLFHLVDISLLTVFPFLRNSCGEAVMILKK